jgi:two-component system NarL family sensor kinase
LKTAPGQPGSRSAPPREIARLRARLANVEETLRAIQSSEVDTLVVEGPRGPQVFTLQGAERSYRVLIESMNEGALTLTADKLILYANQCFARMVKCPLEQVSGNSLRRFLSAEDRAMLRPLLQRGARDGAKIQVQLQAGDGSHLPVQISICPQAGNGFDGGPFGVVVTDMTEARRTEELMRALTRRVVQVQESERGRVALELHDNITQLLCAVLFRSQVLVDKLSARDGPAKREAMKLRRMLGHAAEEVERISSNLRPGVLDQLGLVAVLRDTTTKFADRTGVSVKLVCMPLPKPLPTGVELTLYRILQEALKNVEQHARARHVTADLRKQGAFVQLAINDDGIGFDPDRSPGRKKKKPGLGLLAMRERAAYVGGTFKIKSAHRFGTEIEVLIPLLPAVAAAS